MNNGKQIPVGGLIGEEFKKVYRELERNKIVPSAGQRVSHTSNGTVIKTAGEAGTASPQKPQAVVMTRAAGNMTDGITAQPFIEDTYGRVIALPPIQSHDLREILRSFRPWQGALVDGYDSGSFPWGFIYPLHYSLFEPLAMASTTELFLANGGWRADLLAPTGVSYSGYKPNEPILIAELVEPIRIPIRMHNPANWTKYRTGTYKAQLSGGPMGDVAYVECDFIDLNMAGKFWTDGF